MTLKSKISGALCLAFVAVLAGLAPAYLALSEVEKRFASGLADNAAGALGENSAALLDQLNFALLAMAPGAASVFVVLVALAILARRSILHPLNALADTVDAARAGKEYLQRVPDVAGEFGALHRAIAGMQDDLTRLAQDADRKTSDTAQSTWFADFAGTTADLLWETDSEGCLTQVSGPLSETSAADPGALSGKPFSALLSVPSEGHAPRALRLDGVRPVRNLVCNLDLGDGDAHMCRVSAHPLQDADGRFLGYRGLAHDITDELSEHAAMRELAYFDPLTSLANANMLQGRVSQALEARAISQGEVAVLLIDIDRFKAVNAGFGHAFGDRVLAAVAERLTTLAGPQDTVARLYGKTFAIVQTSNAQPEAAEHLGLSILKRLRSPIEIDDQTVELTASVGSALAAPDDETGERLLQNADTALHRAKADGGDRYLLHDCELTRAVEGRLSLERDLRHAIQLGGIEVFYQPVYTAASGAIAGFDTHIRWPREGHGTLAPEDFLPLAEETGLIAPLAEHVLRTACRTAMSWPDLSVGVRLSPLAFLHETLLPTVVQVLGESCLPAHLLELEINESALLSAEDAAIFQFDALREIGVRLVIDRFGSGSSSLQHLQRFRFDKMILSREFIARVDVDANSAEIVRSVLQLGHALSMETAAEGVVRENQARKLRDLGCQQLQGAYLGKALSSNRAFALLRGEGIMPGAPKAERHL